MKNSKNKLELGAEYLADGWKVVGANQYKKGNITRTLPPDGEYDPWLPLPDDAGELSEHDNNVNIAIDLNSKIAAGQVTPLAGAGNVPSAWIDHAGLKRNRKIRDQAEKEALAALKAEYEGKLYTRDGCRFVKI